MKFLPQNENFLAIEEEYSNPDNSAIVIVPAPYEHTVSYGHGTAKGPKGILDASAFVEFFDDETGREICFEKGIATLPPLDFTEKFDQIALGLIEETVDKLLEMDKFVVTLGGEHTISIAPINSHYKKYPDMSILHFDAHSDLRDSYEDSRYSHACFMSRVGEFFPSDRITQVGIRAQCREESEVIKSKNIQTFYASAIRTGKHGRDWQKKVVESLGNEIYVTFDVDYFDPSIMPCTGTPEPDGFLYSETIDIFRQIKNSGKKVIGLDVVELAPVANMHHADITTARLIYKILNLAF